MLEEELRAASASGILQNVTSLLKQGAIFSADSCGRTPLHLAAACGHKDIVETLVHPKHINAIDAVGRTPLQIAATGGHVEVVRTLLKNGANPNSRDKLHGNTSLHEASWHGFSQTIALLTEHKAATDVRNSAGFAPLHLACQNGHNQTCRELLLADANPDIQNNYGDTPLHTSARYGHAGVARILISASCRVSDQNKNGDTPLHIAAAMGRRKLTTILLEAGCDKSIRNKQYETACDIATRKDLNEIIIILQNVKPNKTNKKKTKKTSETSDSDKKSKVTARVAHDPRACGSAVRWSPYGCHYYPDPNAFPQPRLDSLPGEPLSKGEQYYLDLAGNIRKGPVGVGLTCYCANFLRDMEARLEKSNTELRKRIRSTRCELEQRVTRTEGLLAEWLGTAAVGDTRQSRKTIKTNNRSQRRRGRSHSLDLLSNVDREDMGQQAGTSSHSSKRSSVVMVTTAEDNRSNEITVTSKLLETDLSEKVNELTVKDHECDKEEEKSSRERDDEEGGLWETATPPYSEIEKLPYRSRVGVYSPTFMGLSDQEDNDNQKNIQSQYYVPETVNKINEKSYESQESHNLQGSNLV